MFCYLNTGVSGPPRGPLRVREISDVTGALELAWGPPLDQGGLPIIGYLLEVRQGRSFNWKPYPMSGALVATREDDKFQPTHIITDIQPNKEYFFRVSAVNGEGQSTPLTSEDSYVKKVNLAPPKLVVGHVLPLSEEDEQMGKTKPKFRLTWEKPYLMLYESQPKGFKIERLDVDSRSVQWEQLDFIPITDLDQMNYVHESIAPRLQGAYTFRVLATYTEGESQPVQSGILIAHLPKSSRPGSRFDQTTIPPVSSILLKADSRMGYELEWSVPKVPESDLIKGFTLEDWDDRNQKWTPLTQIESIAPRKLFLTALKRPSEDYRMRIISHGDQGRSIPTEFGVHDDDFVKPDSRTKWTALPTASTDIGKLYDLDKPMPRPQLFDSYSKELDFDTHPDAFTDVDDFIKSRRQIASDMIQTIRTPSTSSRQQGLTYTESPSGLTVQSRTDLSRPMSRTLILSDRLKAEFLNPYSVLLDWSQSSHYLANQTKINSFDIQRWDSKSMNWISIGLVKTKSADYTITGLKPNDAIDGWWFRVIPLDYELKSMGAPYQMTNPIYPHIHRLTVPSSVWGVEILPSSSSLGLHHRAVEVNWMKPSNDGGSNLLGYRLIVHDADENTDKEIIIAPKSTYTYLDALDMMHHYRVTITAFNEIGDSLPVTSTVPHHPALVEMPCIPMPPNDFRIRLNEFLDKDESNCVLSWLPPIKHASNVDFYVIEKWTSQTKQWIPFKKVPSNLFELEVPHLLTDVEYAFRIRSQNTTGLSNPLTLETKLRPGSSKDRMLDKPLLPPSPTSFLELKPSSKIPTENSMSRLMDATDMANRIMQLCWEQPKYSEFSMDEDVNVDYPLMDKKHTDLGPIRGYVIEARREGQTNWALLGRIANSSEKRWNLIFGQQPILNIPRSSPTLSRTFDSNLIDLDFKLPNYFLDLPSQTSWLKGEPDEYEFRLFAENEYGLSRPSILKRKKLEEQLGVDLIKPYFVPSAPRGPISMELRKPSRSDKSNLDQVYLTWKPPFDMNLISGYEIVYRSPYEHQWKSIGKTDYPDSTEIRISPKILDELTDSVHVGIRSRGLTGKYELSEPIEEVLTIPKPSYPLPRSTYSTSKGQNLMDDNIYDMDRSFKDHYRHRPLEVEVSVYKPRTPRSDLAKTDSNQITVDWRLTNLSHPISEDIKGQPDSYVIYFRDLGKTEWYELDVVPAHVFTARIDPWKLPKNRDFYIGVAPIRGSMIGPVTSTLDTIRLDKEIDSKLDSMDYFQPNQPAIELDKDSLKIHPDSPQSIDIQWTPSTKLFHLYPDYSRTDYLLEMKRPFDLHWKPIDSKVSKSKSLSEFYADCLKPGEDVEFRLSVKSGPFEPSFPISNTFRYKFLPPFGKLFIRYMLFFLIYLIFCFI